MLAADGFDFPGLFGEGFLVLIVPSDVSGAELEWTTSSGSSGSTSVRWDCGLNFMMVLFWVGLVKVLMACYWLFSPCSFGRVNRSSKAMMSSRRYLTNLGPIFSDFSNPRFS
jgi:hypothetical protein